MFKEKREEYVGELIWTYGYAWSKRNNFRISFERESNPQLVAFTITV